MHSSLLELSVVVPCYNEESVICESYGRLSGVMKQIGESYELIFINDGSLDKTEEILEQIAKTESTVKIISFSKNFGHQNALSAGIKYCRGKLAVIIDADLQDPPEVIPEMLRMLRDESANVVYGVRKLRKGESFFKRSTAKIFYRFMNYLSETEIPVDTGDFRIIDRKVIDAFNNLPEKNKYIRGLISWIGYKQVPVYYIRDERFAGKTKFSLSKMASFASTGLLYFSKKPLKLASFIGIVSISLGLMYVVLNLFYLFLGIKIMVTGWTSLLVIIVFFSGVQLFTIGVLGQYIGILFDEIKNRPEYIVRKMTNI